MDDEELEEKLEVIKNADTAPIEVIVTNKDKKEFDELDHDDDEYQDMGITKEQLKDFEDGDSSG